MCNGFPVGQDLIKGHISLFRLNYDSLQGIICLWGRISIKKVFFRRCSSKYVLIYIINVLLENFAMFTGKQLRWSLFFNKVTGLPEWRPPTYWKETPTQVFSYEYWEIFKNTFFIEHLQWLLLIKIHNKTFSSRKFICQNQLKGTLM